MGVVDACGMTVSEVVMVIGRWLEMERRERLLRSILGERGERRLMPISRRQTRRGNVSKGTRVNMKVI
jgi:predicted site-specific integrase-resolvase